MKYKYTTTDIPTSFAEQLKLLPYQAQIRQTILHIQKYYDEDANCVIHVSPNICQGGFKLFGCDVIANPMLGNDKIYVIKKGELNKYICPVDVNKIIEYK